MKLLSKEDICRVFSMKDAVDSVKEAFRLFSQGKAEIPLRTNIQAEKNNGSLLFMPAYAQDTGFASLKIINLYPDNLEKGMPTSYAQVILINAETGEIAAMLDGSYVTQLRTGAASGVCFDVLGRKDAKTGALIGTGGQARAQLEAMLTVRKLEKVYIYDISKERTEDFVRNMQLEMSDSGTEIIAAESSDAAVENADLLITVTPSGKPVFDASRCRKGITISCVGAYQHHMQEMDPQILVKADKIFFDSTEAVLEESGDILIPLEQGLITQNDFTGEIGQVLTGELAGRENDDEIIVFETVGIGMQDLVTAKAIYEKSQGIGTLWP